MPKSKRNKIVHLTQVKKKGKDHKEDLAKQLETYCAQFKSVYLFDIDQTKSDRLLQLRVRLKEYGRIFAGRNTIVTLTLKSYGDKCGLDFANLIEQISGHRALFFADIKKDDLVNLLSNELPEFCPKLLGHASIDPKTGAKKSKTKANNKAGDSDIKKDSAQKDKKIKVQFVKI